DEHDERFTVDVINGGEEASFVVAEARMRTKETQAPCLVAQRVVSQDQRRSVVGLDGPDDDGGAVVQFRLLETLRRRLLKNGLGHPHGQRISWSSIPVTPSDPGRATSGWRCRSRRQSRTVRRR